MYIAFHRPVTLTMILEFRLDKWSLLIDHILSVSAFYIQCGDDTTKISDNMNANRVIVEVPELGFKPHWDRIFRKAVYRSFRLEGMARGEARSRTTKFISAWRAANKTPEEMSEFLRDRGSNSVVFELSD
jgi:hypothetical protein